jgi:hypothetical protein
MQEPMSGDWSSPWFRAIGGSISCAIWMALRILLRKCLDRKGFGKWVGSTGGTPVVENHHIGLFVKRKC